MNGEKLEISAKDIPDVEFLENVYRLSIIEDGWPGGIPHWVFTWDLREVYPTVPMKVLIAKARRLKKRKLLTGCCCGCRGDFELTPAGYDLLPDEGRPYV